MEEYILLIYSIKKNVHVKKRTSSMKWYVVQYSVTIHWIGCEEHRPIQVGYFNTVSWVSYSVICKKITWWHNTPNNVNFFLLSWENVSFHFVDKFEKKKSYMQGYFPFSYNTFLISLLHLPNQPCFPILQLAHCPQTTQLL